jgi:homoserine O-succinyltransferase
MNPTTDVFEKRVSALAPISSDHRYVMHVGHPEYDADRLAFEYERDRATELSSVHTPENFDLQQAAASWRLASASFFRAWFDSLHPARL